ncbi:MAG: DUF1631 family protein [Burkholderiaceae bacterium]
MAKAAPASPAPQPAVAKRVREFFVQECSALLPPLTEAIEKRLVELTDAAMTTTDMQVRRDLLMAFGKAGPAWSKAVAAAWKRSLVPPTATAQIRLDAMDLSLLDDSVVEKKIVSSRLAQAVLERVSWDFGELRRRMEAVESTSEQSEWDVMRPEVVTRHMVEQWMHAGLTLDNWAMLGDVIQQQTLAHLTEVYKSVNALLADMGVLPDLEGGGGRVRRAADAGRASAPGAPVAPSQPASLAGGDVGGAGGGAAGQAGGHTGGYAGGYAGAYAGSPQASGGGMSGGGAAASAGYPGSAAGAQDTPLGRARNAAVAVVGQLRRVLTDRVPGYDPSRPVVVAPQVSRLMTERMPTRAAGIGEVDIDVGSVDDATRVVRERTRELKDQAGSEAEKATIEIVALMFQSILAEERISPAVRVWFARLQMPVLRVAMAEPEFFGTLQHPARQLIDRMGACVLGFEGGGVTATALEGEIRRMVQMIEQYPETGRRVFRLAFDEFQRFLAKFLTERDETRRAVSVAQQVEQKETLSVQYTIEMRNLLKDIPVHDQVRDFLFKIWTDVMAVAAVKQGAQHPDTLTLKAAAADLVWAASAKPNREDRARVIRDLPELLQRLRQGMSLLGLSPDAQDERLKTLGAILAQAFRSQTKSIAQADIDALGKRLANLEDFVTDDMAGDLALDAHSLEMMLGMDASAIELVPDGDVQPSAAMLGWARELELGHWFRLDHNGQVRQVQYAWSSARKQLHLFAAADGHSVLVQHRRLAAYLQAGLIVPAEQESLTTRATRDALAKLEANPERLLA